MATKKANGEGSISKYGNKWRGQLTIGRDENGKLIRKAFYGKTKKEVDLKLQEYKLKLNAGDLPTDDKITFQQWYYIWLFDFRKNDLKPSTFEKYYGIYSNYILNTDLGKMKLIDIRAAHIQRYFNSLLESTTIIGKNVDYNLEENKIKRIERVKGIKRYVNAGFNAALKHGYINKNYCSNTTLPKTVKEEKITVLSKDEQRAFIRAIEGHKFKTLFYMALGTGLRQGELLALKWSDIDFNNKIVSVTKSIKRVYYIDRDGKKEMKIIEQIPKTENSIRDVNIPDNVIILLKQHQNKQKEIKLKNGTAYNDMNYIFCNDLGEPIDSKSTTRNFQSVLKKINIPKMPFHALRHTYATRLFEAGVPVKTVQVLMGHKDIATTMNIYTHVMPEEKSKAADKINNLFITQS